MGKEAKIVGYVRKSWQDRGYGFIVPDAEPDVQLYFRRENTLAQEVPERGAVVRFRVLSVGIPNKNDRAVDVEVLAQGEVA